MTKNPDPASRLRPCKLELDDADRQHGGLISVGEEKILRDLDERLAEWSRANEGNPHASLTLAAIDAWSVCSAAGYALRYVDSLRREARARDAALAVPASKRFETYALVRGFGGRDEGFEPNRRRNAAEVVATYLEILDSPPEMTAIGERIWATTGDTALKPRYWPLPPYPRTREQALAIVTEIYRFDSASAARKFLQRAQTEIRRRRTGWRAAFPTDLRLPSNR